MHMCTTAHSPLCVRAFVCVCVCVFGGVLGVVFTYKAGSCPTTVTTMSQH